MMSALTADHVAAMLARTAPVALPRFGGLESRYPGSAFHVSSVDPCRYTPDRRSVPSCEICAVGSALVCSLCAPGCLVLVDVVPGMSRARFAFLAFS